MVIIIPSSYENKYVALHLSFFSAQSVRNLLKLGSEFTLRAQGASGTLLHENDSGIVMGQSSLSKFNLGLEYC